MASLSWLPSTSPTHLWALFCPLPWKRARGRGRDIFPEACVILPHSNSESSPFSFIHVILILIWDREAQGKWGLEGLPGSPAGYLEIREQS